jgi:hypothetical protein
MPNSRVRGVWKLIGAKLPQAGMVFTAFFVGLHYGRDVLTTALAPYDDEGYLLLSRDLYLKGGHLYTQIFSDYGPFYFFAEKGLFRLLHLPVNHDAGRLVASICWLLSTVLAGYFIYKVSRNTILAVAAGLASVPLTSVLALEPGHPQQLILPLLMLGCCASITEGAGGLLLLGAVGAALSLTKINVGLFYFVALALTLVCGFPAGRIRSIGGSLLIAYAAVAPILLMHRDVPGSAGGYCLVAMVCGISTFRIGFLTTPSSPKPTRRVLYAVIGAVSVGVLIVAGTIWQGTSFSALLDGILWFPLKHPALFWMPLKVSRITIAFAGLVSVCVAGLYWFRDRWQDHSDWVDAARCMIGLLVIAMLAVHPLPGFIVDCLPSLLAFLPLSLIPTKGQRLRQSNYFPRLFVTSLAATQFLQAYPVAGSQLNIAAAPLLLWGFLCVHDGAGGLFHRVPGAMDSIEDFFAKESVLGGLIALVITGEMLISCAWVEREHLPASSLRGSASLHLTPDLEATYEFISSNIRENCDVLFTMPGMGSFNFWSGVPTPNGLNITNWMKELNPEQQGQILQILRANSRACVVYNPKLVTFWEATKEDLDALPLARYVLYSMPKVSQMGSYEIRVHPERRTAWISIPATPAAHSGVQIP